MNLGEIIKKYREENNVSQDIIAERSGYSKSYISILERNINPKNGEPPIPSIKAIKSLAKAIGSDFPTVFNLLDDGIKVSIEESIPMDWDEESTKQEKKGLTPKEHTHIKKYRLLNENGQIKTDDYMDDLLKVDQYRAGEKEEFSKPLAPDPTIDYDAAIEEAEAEIARTPYARIAAYGGKNMFVKEAADEEDEDAKAEWTKAFQAIFTETDEEA